MREDLRRRPVISFLFPVVPWLVVFLFYFVMVLMVVPAAALAPSVDNGMTGVPDGVTILDPLADMSVAAAAPDNPLKVRPSPTLTPIPVKQNRSITIPALAKTVAERPKVTIPTFWFILIVGTALIGLGAILYLLIRRKKRSPAAQKSLAQKPNGQVTVIDLPATGGGAGGAQPSYPEPAVPFPPSLQKRFMNPEFIGEGGLARVFRAQNVKTGEMVAVKIPMRFDEATGTHFTRDIVFWQGLEHENIIRIYSSNILPIPYIEMEYAPSSLAAIPLPLPEEKAVAMVLGIGRGLAYAHGKGIVHRDIKPENILIAADGTPKITDWGLGKAIGDTRKSSMIGFSPAYAAPEQIAPHKYGRPGPATDIYQLGMLLAELLTGSVLFKGEGLHDLNIAILNDPPVIPAWKGEHTTRLREILIKCLSKHPEDRYESVEVLVRDLESIRFLFE
jgi:eukaryotic-like serine/threonine-protein kinase